MTVELDLPVLPEGYFWRVRDLSAELIRASSRYGRNNGEMVVEIVERGVTKYEARNRVKIVEASNLWIPYYKDEFVWKETMVEEVRFYKRLADYKLVRYDAVHDLYKEGGWMLCNSESDRNLKESSLVKIVKLWEVGPGNILKVAEELFEMFTAALDREALKEAEKERRSQYVGVYGAGAGDGGN